MSTQAEQVIKEAILELPLEIRVLIVALKEIQDARVQLERQEEKEINEIRNKYKKKINPLLQRSSQLLQGKQPTQQQLSQLSNYLKPNQKKPARIKTVQGYWNCAMENSQLAHYITEQDQRALESLLDLQLLNTDNDDLKIKFVFKPNSYFQETTLVRTIKVQNGKAICVEGDTLTVKGTNWLTHEAKKVNNKTTGQKKVVQGQKINSFFDIFLNWNSIDNPAEFQKCCDIFDLLSEVIRNSLCYFLGLIEQDDIEDQEQQQQDEEDDGQEQQESQKKKVK